MAIHFHPPLENLTWNLYRRVPRSLDGFDASTEYRISFRSRSLLLHGRATGAVTVTVSLVAHDTWVVADKRTTALFAHERLHYAIAVLVGRELEPEIGALVAPALDALASAQQKLLTAKTNRALEIETAYDDQTDHSRNVVQQNLWAARVERWLRAGKITWP